MLPDESEIVAYVKQRIACGNFTVYGKVIKLTGKSKRPGSSKEYSEHQVEVEKFECE